MSRKRSSPRSYIPVPPLPEAARLSEELGANASPWLDRYVEFSRLWSPKGADRYHEDVGLWVLSAVARGRVRYPMGKIRKTGLYVLLVGPTSLNAKTSTADVGVGLLRECNLEGLLIEGKVTPRKFIEIMSCNLPEGYLDASPKAQERMLAKLANAGQRAWLYEEMGNDLIRMNNAQSFISELIDVLLRLDDASPSHSNLTLGRGEDVIDQPYLAFLGVATLANLEKSALSGASIWGDGFLARFIISCPPEGERNSGRFPTGKRVYPQELIQPLLDWDYRLGTPSASIDVDSQKVFIPHLVPELKISSEVEDAFYRYNETLEALGDEIRRVYGTEDLLGNYCRFAEKAMRIAALFASSNGEQVIQLSHFAKAQGITERQREALHHAYNRVNGFEAPDQAGSGNQPPIYGWQAESQRKVLDVLAKRGPMDDRDICNYAHLGTMEMTRGVRQALLNQGRIEQVTIDGKEKYQVLSYPKPNRKPKPNSSSNSMLHLVE